MRPIPFAILTPLYSPAVIAIPVPISVLIRTKTNKQLHGRSRQQRYSKLANWSYIKECVDTLHAATDDAGLPRVPMFGNGDCYSAQQYWEEKEASGVDGVLVARGALIKPWLFTEIKERREWDISASERLDIVKQVRLQTTSALHFQPAPSFPFLAR